MGRRTMAIPLPRTVRCEDCADTLHVRLAQTPGVHNVTFDNSNRKVFVTADEDDFVYGTFMGVIAGAFSGSRQPEGLAAGHRGHDEQDAAPTDDPAPTEYEGAPDDGRKPGQNRKRLLFVAVVGAFIMTGEVVAGVAANSLVLLADAAHYATDLLAVLLAYFAISWGLKAATQQKTFGYQRAEVIAAFVQAIGLWAISLFFLWEAYQRIQDPPEVGGPIVAVVGGATMILNAGLAWVLHQGEGQNINMRAAYLHILSDVLGSAAALVAGVLVVWRGWHIADPILTLFITGLILIFTLRLTKQTLHILLEGTPTHVDPAEVESSLLAMEGV